MGDEASAAAEVGVPGAADGAADSAVIVCHALVASCRLKHVSASDRSCEVICRMRCSRYFRVFRCTISDAAVAS